MKKLILLSLILLLFLIPLTSDAIVSVKGYFRKDGTYVAPHFRSDPDGITSNNWSYPGNTNPMTGKTATGSPTTYTLPSVPKTTYAPTYMPPSLITCPINSYLATDNKCYCNTGYVVDVKNNICLDNAIIQSLLNQIYNLQKQINELLAKRK